LRMDGSHSPKEWKELALAPGAGVEVRYGLKIRLTILSRLARVALSTGSSHSRMRLISRLISLMLRGLNMPWVTLDHDWSEYASSQITLDAVIKADIKSRWPEEKLSVGKRTLRRWRRTRAAKVTEGWGLAW
jgi:hypothetical protein